MGRASPCPQSWKVEHGWERERDIAGCLFRRKAVGVERLREAGGTRRRAAAAPGTRQKEPARTAGDARPIADRPDLDP